MWYPADLTGVTLLFSLSVWLPSSGVFGARALSFVFVAIALLLLALPLLRFEFFPWKSTDN
eukprot:5707204-Ditylum_brightwellii.AAC.1